MHIALLLYHGVRPDAPSEASSHSHVEILGSTTVERERLRVLAEQLREFGSIPFSYKEMDSIDETRHGCVLRVALAERPAGPDAAGGNR